MNPILFPIHLFPSIEYYAYLVQAKDCLFEKEDHFQKQTYRNRYYIFSSNGKLTLNIPISHQNNSRFYKDTLISYDVNWQKNHIKSLRSAYQSSPFFEFYEDDLLPLFEKKEKFLIDFNEKTTSLVNNLLSLNIEIKKTAAYDLNTKHRDLREAFNTKQVSNNTFEPYIQVFSTEKGFIKNLSILDLLFNEGPNTTTYLENIKLI